MDISENTLQVNKFARRTRHLKVFSRSNYLTGILKAPLKSLLAIPWVRKTTDFLTSTKSYVKDVLPVAPKSRILFQSSVLGLTALVVSSFSTVGTFNSASMSYNEEYIQSYAIEGNILVADESGYIVKVNPQTETSSRIGLTDYAVHTIESGESLSVIAVQYEVSANSIMWENNLSNANSIRTGQKLLIPPVDGIGYKVASGDSLEKIATKYDISVESIIAQNALGTDVIQKGQALFLPGAEPIKPVYTASNTNYYRNSVVTRDDRTTTTSSTNAAASTATPATGQMFIFPTRGKITQGYHGGHYALDIADRSKPPIWAAGGGSISKVSTGTWGGGYGNHVIIDHGNGIKTLYAHMDTINVYVGQNVSQGDVLGIMGNTGRVYGVTGIHLHWEVFKNGVKQNPYNYF